MLLLLPRGLDRQDGLAILVLHHLQRDLGVPALVLRAPKVDLLALSHHHGEVHVLALALHAVHGLHVGKVQFLELDRRLEAGHGGASGLGRLDRTLPGLLLLLLVVVVLQLFGRDEQQPLLGEDAALLLPELQQPVAALLQHALLQRLAAAALQHPPGIGGAAARLGLSASSRPGRGQQQQPRAVLAPTAPAASGPERAEEANAQKAGRRRRLGVRAAGQPRPDAPQGPGAASRRGSAVLLRALTEGHWPGPLAALLNGPYPPPPSDTQRKRRLLAPAPRGKAQLGEALRRRRAPHSLGAFPKPAGPRPPRPAPRLPPPTRFRAPSPGWRPGREPRKLVSSARGRGRGRPDCRAKNADAQRAPRGHLQPSRLSARRGSLRRASGGRGTAQAGAVARPPGGPSALRNSP